ncbi:MAG: TlpA disulfide reductase family protein [Thermoactinomyces sp.]
MKWKNVGVLLLIVAAVAGTVWFYAAKGGEKETAVGAVHCQGEPQPDEGYCAPNFKLATIDGRSVELSQNDGKPTVVNFWTTWCGYCKEEMPYFQKAYNHNKNRVNFIMVNMTAMERKPEEVALFLKENHYTFPVAMDPVKNGQTVGIDQYHLFGVPATFVVGTDGKILHKFVGGIKEQDLFSVINQLVK